MKENTENNDRPQRLRQTISTKLYLRIIALDQACMQSN